MRLLLVAVVCTSITLGAGCSREVRSTVRGKVDYDGQMLNSGYILFQVNYLVTKGAEIASDGSYVVDGLPYGSAAVSICVDDHHHQHRKASSQQRSLGPTRKPQY